MRKLTLTRFCVADFGTFGKMSVDGATLWTVERPWLDNMPNVSCIPEGTYECGPRPFFRGGYDAIEIENVAGRTHILFHTANWPHEVQGCIAPNSWIGPGSNACPMRGFDSRTAFNRLMEWMGGERFTLVVE